MAFLNLSDVSTQLAGSLSHGQKQWLEIGMAIALKPKLLLLDEPTAGMSPAETHATGEIVKTLNADGVTILAVEHDMSFVRQVAQRVTVLHLGRIFAQGTMEEIVAEGVRTKPDIRAIATRSDHGVEVLVWNYHDDDILAAPASIDLRIEDLPKDVPRALLQHFRIDAGHSTSFAAWKAPRSRRC